MPWNEVEVQEQRIRFAVLAELGERPMASPPSLILPSPAEQPVLFYADGRTATVGAHVVHSLDLVVLTTNGKPDASLGARWLESTISDSLPRAPIVNQDDADFVILGIGQIRGKSKVVIVAKRA